MYGIVKEYKAKQSIKYNPLCNVKRTATTTAAPTKQKIVGMHEENLMK